MSNDDSHHFWAVPTGAALAATVMLCLALVAGGGWNWFAAFLTSSASGWAQAVGTVLAVVAAARIAGRDQARRDEQALVVAEFTASAITGLLEPFALHLGGCAERFLNIGKFDCPPEEFARIYGLLSTAKMDLTEEQMQRLSPVPKAITHNIIDSIGLYNSAIKFIDATAKNKDLISDTVSRKKRAREIAPYLIRAHRFAEAARIDLLKFLADRGVAMHKIEDEVIS